MITEQAVAAYIAALSEIRSNLDYWEEGFSLKFNEGLDPSLISETQLSEEYLLENSFTVKRDVGSMKNGENTVLMAYVSPAIKPTSAVLPSGVRINLSDMTLTSVPTSMSLEEMSTIVTSARELNQDEAVTPMSYYMLAKGFIERGEIAVGDEVKVMKFEKPKGIFMWEDETPIEARTGSVTSIRDGAIYVNSKKVPFFAVKKVEIPVFDSEIGTIRILSSEIEMGILDPISHEQFEELYTKIEQCLED